MLKEAREKAGLTQEGLAEKTGLSLRSIQNWEQGRRAGCVSCWRWLRPWACLSSGSWSDWRSNRRRARGESPTTRRPRRGRGRAKS